MTDDLPERLRDSAWYKRRNGDDVLMKEAAAELVRLRAALETIAFYEGNDIISDIDDPLLRGVRYGERQLAQLAAKVLNGEQP